MSQHRDDPLFAEFIEAHVNDNTAWIKEALQKATNSDDDSAVEDEQIDVNEKKETQKPESNDKKETKQEEKIANKHISDLEVYYAKCYNNNVPDDHSNNLVSD